jgi:light-regulated signal transduction histidine kinase (bacteriophytochrome)
MADLASMADVRTPDRACAIEPIHSPGSIQPHGILLAADPAHDLMLIAASANATTLPGSGGNPFAQPVAAIMGEAFAASLRQRAQSQALAPEIPWETTITLPGRHDSFDVSTHAHAGLVIVEIEPTASTDAGNALSATRRLQHAIASLRAEQGGLEDLAATAARGIRLMTGYERVLVYRFDPDWNGQAIAEDQVADWPQRLLGLHFPASDIPAQARAMYCRSLLRWVPSRDAVPVPLHDADGNPARIDLTHARLRSLSPTHMQYHRNLGVDGTMSLSIIVAGQLWGLVVCHHRQPHRTSPGQRAAAAALTDAFALRIVPAERAGSEAARRAEHRLVAKLVAQMAQVDDLPQALSTGAVTLRHLFGASGAAVVQGRTVTAMGDAPGKSDVLALAAWLRETAPDASPDGSVFATETLPDLYPDWAPHTVIASGLMAVFLTEDRSDLLLWFRPEEARQVSWGGKPVKELLPGDTTLAPRQSFERWIETRHGHARQWQSWEREIAGLLRHAITEVIVRNLRRITSLSEQLRQSQKMEAVGQLTGGLAHDFNNLLGGIVGALEIAGTRLAQGRTGELERYLTAAMGAANRAAALTHRLLAFSRRQTLDPRPTDAGRLVASMEDLVRRTTGPAIALDIVTSAGLWTILCDGNQLENALLNLALNARDAMPDGGRLTIEAGNVRLDDAYAVQCGVPAGHYVAISVSDTGSGMTPDTVAHAFEPFFTTKPMGTGTGLGLSMVYGFAKQSGGHARIYSEPGHGTTVRIYLPRHHGAALDEAAPNQDEPEIGPGIATILVVDDEPVLRMLVCEVLREQGFSVLEAADGPAALDVVERGRSIDLLITDVGLPGGLNGRQVADAIRGFRPGIKVLFITGYAETAALDGGLLDPNTQVLTKPFEMQALRTKVRAMVR